MKIVVFDDDPTGSQTVHGCPLLLSWQEEILSQGLNNPSPLLFLLANTRAMSPESAKSRLLEICQSIKTTFASKNLNFEDVVFISRGDSTLRGHGVLEPEILSQQLGPFDATFHVPAFIEGGRTTVDGMHLLNDSPVHLSHFASDQIFGYSTSYLPNWLEEKSKGNICAQDVRLVTICQLEAAINTEQGMQKLLDFLKSFSNNVPVVVDAHERSHLKVFAQAILTLKNDKKFLFRSAASLISAFAQLPENPINSSSLFSLKLKNRDKSFKGGLIMVGSHVHLADQQLERLLIENDCEGIELPASKISRVLDGSLPDFLLEDLENVWFDQIKKILNSGKTPVLYTSRGEINFSSISKRLSFGLQLAEVMARLAAKLVPDLGYLITKGGITSQILLEKGLGLGIVELKGQILPGLSIVCPYENRKFQQIPIITFPGNLGDSSTLLKAWRLMEETPS